MDRQNGKKNILFVCPSLEAGGAEKLLIRLLRRLDRSRFVLHLAVFRFTGRWAHDLPPDVRVYDLRKRHRLDFFTLVRLLARDVLPAVRPDAVLSFLWYANVVSLLACLFSPIKTRVIVSEHTSTVLDPMHRRFFVRILLRFLYPRADKIVAVSTGLKRELAARYAVSPDLISVIHNCIDLRRIRSRARERLGDPAFRSDRRPIVVACGRLLPVKNFLLLIRSFALLPKTIGARLYIIGEGNEESALRQLIRARRLDGRVSLLGYRENPYQYMAAADVFALSSRFEGFGNVIVEAMACGVPVVATDCPFGPREIIEDGKSGLLTPPGDEKGLAAALRRALTEKPLRARLIREGGKRAARFDVSRIVKDYERLFT